jgi:hypothetical protein
MEVRAAAVVLGATVQIDPPSIDAIVGARVRRSCNWSQPRPSRTSSTTWSASAADGGSQEGASSN